MGEPPRKGIWTQCLLFFFSSSSFFFSFPLLESTLLRWPEFLVLDPNWLIKAFYRVWRVSGFSGRLRDIDKSEEQFPTPLRDPPSRNPQRPSPPATRHLRHRSWSLAGTCSHPSLSALESWLGPGTRPPPAQGRMAMQSPGLPMAWRQAGWKDWGEGGSQLVVSATLCVRGFPQKLFTLR